MKSLRALIAIFLTMAGFDAMAAKVDPTSSNRELTAPAAKAERDGPNGIS